MTREDALNKTIGILTYHQVNFCKSKEAVANMNEIIEALEKIDQKPCDDAISRQAVLEVIKKCHCEEWIKSDIGAPIEALPSVSPQPKLGRWAVLKDEYGDVCEAVCSCCDKNGNHKWAFCPFCGAKMSDVDT